MIFKPILFAWSLSLIPTMTLRAPTPIEWRKDLPSAQSAPDGSIVLPAALALEVLAHLKYADEYEALCQDMIDQQHAIDQDKSAQQLEEEKAKRGVPAWVIPVSGGLGVVLGVVGSVFIFQAVR